MLGGSSRLVISALKSLESQSAVEIAVKSGEKILVKNNRYHLFKVNLMHHMPDSKLLLQNNLRDTQSLNDSQRALLRKAQVNRNDVNPDYPYNPSRLVSQVAGESLSTDRPQGVMLDPHHHKKMGVLFIANQADIEQVIEATRTSSWHQFSFAQRASIIEQAVDDYLYDDDITAALMASQCIATPKQDPWTELREERDDERLEKLMVKHLLEQCSRGEIELASARPKAHFLVENFANMLGLRELRFGLITGAMVSVVGDGMTASHHFFMASTFRELLIKHGAPEDVLQILVTDLAGKRFFNQRSGFDTYLVGGLKTARAVKHDMETYEGEEGPGRFYGSAQGPNMLFVGSNVQDMDAVAELAKNSAALENAGQCTQLHVTHIDPQVKHAFQQKLLVHAEQHDQQSIRDPLDVLIQGEEPFQRVRSSHLPDASIPEGVSWLKPLDSLSGNESTFGVREAALGISPSSIPENWRHPALTLYSDQQPDKLAHNQKPIAVGIIGRDDWVEILESFTDVTVFSISHPDYSMAEDGQLRLTYPVAARPGNGEHFREAGVSNKGPAWGNPGINEFFQPMYQADWVLEQAGIAEHRMGALCRHITSILSLNPEEQAYYVRYMGLFDDWATQAIDQPFAVNQHYDRPSERTVVTGLAMRPFEFRITPENTLKELAIAFTVAGQLGLPGRVSMDYAELPDETVRFIQQVSVLPDRGNLLFVSELEAQWLGHLKDDGTPVLCRAPSSALQLTMADKRAPLIAEDLSRQLPAWLVPSFGCYPRHIKTTATGPESADAFCKKAMALKSWIRWNPM